MSKYDDAVMEIAKEYSWVGHNENKTKQERERWCTDLGRVVDIMDIAKKKGYLNKSLVTKE